jgi:hypothetical protein
MGAVVGVVYGAIILTSSVVQERLTAQGPLDYRGGNVGCRFSDDPRSPLVRRRGMTTFLLFYKRYAHWDVYLRGRADAPQHVFVGDADGRGGGAGSIPGVPGGNDIFRPERCGARPGQQGDTWLADITGVFLASMAAVLAPAFVMDILSGYYNTMVMFLVIGGYFGMVAGERRRASAPHVAASPVTASPVTAPSISGETAGEG